MKKIIFSIILMLMPLGMAFAQDVVGKWKLEDGTAIVEVYKSGDAFNGKIVWLANPTEADGSPAVDSNNPDKSLRSRKLIGLNMLSGLKADGGEYSGGNPVHVPERKRGLLRGLHGCGGGIPAQG